MRDGREVRLTATIQAIAPPVMLADESDESNCLSAPLHNVSATRAPGDSRLTAAATGIIGLKNLELDAAASSCCERLSDSPELAKPKTRKWHASHFASERRITPSSSMCLHCSRTLLGVKFLVA
jgi:hypothetical protein